MREALSGLTVRGRAFLAAGVTAVVCAAVTLPAFAGMLARRWQGAVPVIAAMLSCSLIFFVATNFAVWAFNGMYPMTFQGLTQCYVAALPFLDKTVMGDLFWTAVLFGGLEQPDRRRPCLDRGERRGHLRWQL